MASKMVLRGTLAKNGPARPARKNFGPERPGPARPSPLENLGVTGPARPKLSSQRFTTLVPGTKQLGLAVPSHAQPWLLRRNICYHIANFPFCSTLIFYTQNIIHIVNSNDNKFVAIKRQCDPVFLGSTWTNLDVRGNRTGFNSKNIIKNFFSLLTNLC